MAKTRIPRSERAPGVRLDAPPSSLDADNSVIQQLLEQREELEAPSFLDIAGDFFDSMGPQPPEPAPVLCNPIFDGLSYDDVAPTSRGTLEGFLPGESRHKKVTKQVFQNLRSDDMPHPDGSWRERQDGTAWLASQGGVEPDAKLTNDVFVAQILADKDIMKTAAQFALEMSGMYGPKGDRADFIRGKKGEMAHMWPDQDTSGTKNQDYRGWGSVLTGFASSKDLSTGLGANGPKLEELVGKEGDYSLEESMYITRAMGQLRDVMKKEKGKGGIIPEWIDGYDPEDVDEDRYPIEPRNRIRVSGPKIPGNHDDPSGHGSSRGFTRWMQPLGTLLHSGKTPYEVEDRADGEPGNFDYLQGTSGTTLDMLNFFLAQGKEPDEAAKLMQAFYANWHAVAPDGNAHSQSESMGTMLQYLYGTNLQAPIMTPIKGEADVDSMRDEGGVGRGRYANPLTPEAPGFLALGRRAAKKED